ncbi:MAG TPA: ABC transporter ATP-binding protein [Burkholderiaceae bacterium]
MAPETPLLAIRGLRFRWPGAGSDCLAVDNLDLRAGEAVFVHGPSGCGKSTLLSLLAGVLVADAGKVSLMGRDWRELAGAARDAWRVDHVGYIFQQFNLLPYLSALDNVLLPCRFSRLRRKRAGADGAPKHAAQTLLLRVGLDGALWRKRATELSVGQQQRVAAARALIGQPELVIADEPTSALDEALREVFMQLLTDACRRAGSALVFVSHDQRLAAYFDRTVELPLLNVAQPIEVAA